MRAPNESQLRLLSLAVFVCAAGPAVVRGADAAVSSDQSTLEEVTVTAQKRAENAQTVPISMNVLSASSLQGMGIASTQRLTEVVPGLTIGNISGTAQPYIRGIGSSTQSEFTGTSIVVYLDGVLLTSLGQLFRELNDIERIEVLKGPQGILYGRNSTGGAINIVTRDPNAETTANFGVTVGNYAMQKYSATISGGTDILAASLSGFSARHDGFVKNLAAQAPPGVITGSPNRLNDQDVQGGRLKVKYNLSEDWSFLLSGDFSYTHDHGGVGFTNYAVPPLAAAFGGQYSFGPYTTYADYPSHVNATDAGGSLTVRGRLPGINFLSISAYRTFDKSYGIDLDTTDLPVASTQAEYSSQNITQEFQLLSDSSNRLQWIVGGFYLHQIQKQPVQLFVPPTPEIAIYGNDATRSISGFGQLSYQITDNWKISAGGRYTNDEKPLTQAYETVGGAVVAEHAPINSKWSNTSPKLGVEFHQPGMLLYANAGKGYRNGIYSLTSPTAPGPVNPEKITAYEIGGKHDLLGNTLRFNWATYLYNYRDLQVEIVDVNSGITKVENAAASRSYGADLDLTAALTSQFTASLGLAYLHATYTEFPAASILIPNFAAGGNTPAVRDETGEPLLRSPKWSSNVHLQYVQPISQGKLQFAGGIVYNSGYLLDVGGYVRQPSYVTENLRVSFTSNDDHWSFGVFCDNLSNRAYLAGASPQAFATIAQYSDPRTYGARLDYRY